MTPDLTLLSSEAIKAALSAGNIIRKYADEDISVELKSGGENYASQVVTKVDKACDSAIRAHLLPLCHQFDLALLSEESEDDGSRLEKDFFWCVDPMDGTLAFINKQPGFSVSIALVARNGTPIIGVVFDPSTNILYHAIKGKGAFKNQHKWEINSSASHLTYFTDKLLKDDPKRTMIEPILSKLIKQLGLTHFQDSFGGGSVLNAIRVLEHGPACMLKLPKEAEGGGCLWDYAATACIFNELGKTATNFHGGILDLNRADSPFMNHEGVFFSNMK